MKKKIKPIIAWAVVDKFSELQMSKMGGYYVFSNTRTANEFMNSNDKLIKVRISPL